MKSTTTTTRDAHKRGAHEAARPVEQPDVMPDAAQAIHDDDSGPLSTAADEVTIVDQLEPSDRERAEANFIGLLEHEAESDRQEAREAADANGWALHLHGLEAFEAGEQAPTSDQLADSDAEEGGK